MGRLIRSAFLWQAVRGRLLPGRFPWFPVSDPRTVCHHFCVRTDGGSSLIKPGSISRMPRPPFKPGLRLAYPIVCFTSCTEVRHD